MSSLRVRPSAVGWYIALSGSAIICAGVAFLHKLAIAQHHDAVGDLGDHCQVMGDVDGGLIELLGDFLHRRQHLDLGGHIQGSGRLIEDDDIRLAGHGHGHHGALQLSAGDLVGIAVADVLGIGQKQAVDKFQWPSFAASSMLINAVPHRCFGILFDNPVSRIEGGRRTLGHIGDAATPNRAQRPLRGLDQLFIRQR